MSSSYARNTATASNGQPPVRDDTLLKTLGSGGSNFIGWLGRLRREVPLLDGPVGQYGSAFLADDCDKERMRFFSSMGIDSENRVYIHDPEEPISSSDRKAMKDRNNAGEQLWSIIEGRVSYDLMNKTMLLLEYTEARELMPRNPSTLVRLLSRAAILSASNDPLSVIHANLTALISLSMRKDETVVAFGNRVKDILERFKALPVPGGIFEYRLPGVLIEEADPPEPQ